MRSCGASFVLGLLAIFTIGLVLAISVVLLVYFVRVKLDSVDSGLFAVIVILACFSLLVFLFGFYAACCGKKCSRIVVTIVYFVFSLIVIACGVSVLALKKKITSKAGELWENEEKNQKVITEIEDYFKCKGWDEDTNSSSSSSQSPENDYLEDSVPTCKEKFEKFYKKYGNICGAMLLVLGVLLVIGDVVTCNKVCHEEASDDSLPSAERRREERGKVKQPLAYEW